jgi:hypothetical protein
LAAIGVTLGIALLSGALSGFLSSKCGSLDEFFDDKAHFHECEYDIVTPAPAMLQEPKTAANFK